MTAWTFSLRLLATWFGCGRAPFFPGTVGTLGAIPLVWIFGLWGTTPYLIATVAFAVFSVVVAHFYESTLASGHDAPELVIDEVAGFLITMVGVPFSALTVGAGFLLFRALDILKPFPISYLDRKVPGGLGAVADDVIAGLLANLVIQFLWHKGVLG